jgi:hypothetical protein
MKAFRPARPLPKSCREVRMKNRFDCEVGTGTEPASIPVVDDGRTVRAVDRSRLGPEAAGAPAVVVVDEPRPGAARAKS